MATSRFYKSTPITRPQSNDVERGLAVGKEWGSLLSSLGTAIKGARQDAVANRLMNSGAVAPRAALENAGTNPATGQLNLVPENVPIGGTTPLTGGVEGLKLQQEAAKSALEDAYTKARTEHELAQATGTGGYAKEAKTPKTGFRISGGTTPWTPDATPGGSTGKTGKEPKYTGGGDINNPENDNLDRIRIDFDQAHGKGMFDKFAAAYGNGQGLTEGATSYDLKDAKDLTGNTNLASISKDEGQIVLQRVNAARRRMNMPPAGSVGEGSYPGSSYEAGSEQNPILLSKNNKALHLRSIPAGKWVRDPDTGEDSQVQLANAQSATTPPTPAPAPTPALSQ